MECCNIDSGETTVERLQQSLLCRILKNNFVFKNALLSCFFLEASKQCFENVVWV